MSDYFFKRFYKTVKGPDWPGVENMVEFSKLPARIKDECRDVHGLDQRLNELEDKTYWYKNISHSIVYRKDNVVYVPTFKCASTYYTDLVLSQGWVKENIWDLDLEKYKAFGLMLHPFTRRLKGIIQLMKKSFSNDFSKASNFLLDENNRNFVSQISIMDGHTLPYSFLFGSKLAQIDWLPMEVYTDDEIKSSIISFCKQNGVDIIIPRNDKRSNQSSDDRIKLYDSLKRIFLDEYETNAELYLLFADDLKFFHALLNKHQQQRNEEQR